MQPSVASSVFWLSRDQWVLPTLLLYLNVWPVLQETIWTLIDALIWHSFRPSHSSKNYQTSPILQPSKKIHPLLFWYFVHWLHIRQERQANAKIKMKYATLAGECKIKTDRFELPTSAKYQANCEQSPAIVYNRLAIWRVCAFAGDCSQSPISHLRRNI